MYKIKLLERKANSNLKTVSIGHEYEWNIEFKNDKQVQDFFKRIEVIQTSEENNDVKMISTQDAEAALNNYEPLTILEALDENDNSIASNFYKKEDYPYLLEYFEQNK